MKHSTKRLLSIMICLIMLVGLLPVGALAAGNTTVYCQAPDGWTTCKAYWWGSSGSNPGWPGENMTQGEDGIWSFDVPSDATGLIFNNGSGTQTNNLTVPTDENVMYVFANGYWTTYGKVEVTVDYYVAGQQALCGVDWSPNAPENKMTDDNKDGIYTISYENVAAGKYQFKVTKGSWDECWGGNGPDGNYLLELAAVSNVTISFNTADYTISADVEALGEPEVTEPVAATYIVAGIDLLCGTYWDPTDVSNQMFDEDGDGIYTITYVDVPAGEYEFKVTNGSWDESWGGDGPDGNCLLKLDATSTVTISFNTADYTISVDDGKTEVPSDPVATAYYVAGDFNSWTNPDTACLMNVQEDGTYSLTFAVAAGEQGLKVTDGTWDNCWGGNGPDGNYVFTAETDGEITVTFNPTDCSVNVTGDCLGGDEPTYYVGGEGKLCGSEWQADDAANQLTDEDGDGIYTISYTDLASGDYMFKITAGNWETCWGGDGTDGNYVFRLYALSNVTINFNPATGIITLDIEELGEPEDPTVPGKTGYYVVGSINSWNEKDEAYLMTDNGDGTWSLTFEVPTVEGALELKVTDGTWTNSWGDGTGGNVVVEAVEGDTVTVIFDGSSVKVDVAVEQEPMTIISMHVAGSAGLCGEEWIPDANQMACAMGVYSITFTDIAAGTYEFKFVANGDWNLNWASGIEMPSGETQTAWFNAQGNSSVVVAEDGSTVTLTFNMTTMDIVTGEGATTCVVVETPKAPVDNGLAVGDQILIVALESDVAMSTTQNKNNRDEAAIVKADGTIAYGDDVQVITLVEGTKAGTFGFQVGEGQYLYAASSTSNHLKTTDTLDDNASWSIVIDDTTGEASIVACGENSHNILRYNASSKLFSCYASGQAAVCIYKLTGNEPEPPVSKELALGDNELALELGDLDGDTWTFTAAEEGILSINFTTVATDNGMGEMEEVPAEYLDKVLGRDFGVVINGTAVYEYPVEMNVAVGDEVSVLIYSGMGAPAEFTLNLSMKEEAPDENGPTAELVTDIADLKAGDKIIIAALEADVAISNAEKANNRPETGITKNGTSIAYGENVMIITLVEGTVADTFGFQVGEGQYLYAASSKSNYLKIGTTLDDNGAWAITFDAATGEASIVASGENTRNILRYNSGSSLFSCYGSGQAPVCIYKLSAAEEEPSNVLALGDNALTLDARDQDGDTWTFTATEAGALKLNVTALAADDGTGAVAEVPAAYIKMVISRQYTVLVNGVPFDIYNEEYAVDAGDVVSIQIFSNEANATELTLNLSVGAPTVVEPSEPGTTADNPLTIEALPFEINVGEGKHDLYYTYVAEQDGTIVITVPTGNLVSGLSNFEKDADNTYYVTVVAGETVSINPWGEVAGTYTLAYGSAPVEEPFKLLFEQVTVSFKDEFLVNIYFSCNDEDKAVEMGMITFDSQVADYSVFNAKNTYSCIFDTNKGLYRATTGGISAKNMGDDIWLALYAKLEDGSIYYTKLVNYSPETYAYTLLGTADADLDCLLVSMLNYGAAAQLHFGHNTDDLVNKNLTAEQKALVADYSEDMVNVSAGVPTEKQGAFANNGGFSKRYPSVSFKGAFAINYYALPAAAPVDGVTLYYWDEAAYAANEVLTAENATGTVEMALTANGEYAGSVTGIAARKLNSIVYVAFSYSDGTTTQTSGVLPYSIGEYCGYYAGIEHEFTAMAQATAVYGNYAKAYFG